MKIGIVTTIRIVKVCNSEDFGFSSTAKTVEDMNKEYRHWIDSGALPVEDLDFEECQITTSIVDVLK